MDGTHKTKGANSSRKVLQALLSFSERRPTATVAEIATAIGAPVATTYRYVALLKELNLIEEGTAGRYQVGARIMPLARAAQVVNDLAHLAHPTMAHTASQLGETVMLFQRVEDAAVCVERVESDRPMRFTFEPGHNLPLGSGASGKMLLSLLDATEQSRYASRLPEEKRRLLRQELALIQGRQWAESTGEIDEGVWACSVPLPLPHAAGRPAVLSTAGPESRYNAAGRQRAVAELQDAANQIAAAVARLTA